MPARDPAAQLAKELANLRREVNSLSRGSQMTFRSIEGGSVPVYDDHGNLRGNIGQLPDGTTGFVTLNGPKPPTPSAPILEPTVGGLAVTWDGTFFDGVDRPGDFRAIEVHASSFSAYEPTDTTRRASLTSPGTAQLLLPPDPYTVTFVCVSTSGQRSDPAAFATETPERAPTYTEVIAANGKNKVFWRTDDNAPDLVEDKLIDGDLWFQADHDHRPVKWETATASWVVASFGDQALSGLNVGKLVAGEIAAGQKIIAGPQFGTHAEMADDGFRVYRQDPVDGLTDEVIRLGTTTNDYFAVVDTSGELVASIDDTGQANLTGLNVSGDLTYKGTKLESILESSGGRQVGWYMAALKGLEGQSGLGIRSEYGLAQVTFPVRAGRSYLIKQYGPIWYPWANGGEYWFHMRYAKDSVATPSSPVGRFWVVSNLANQSYQLTDHDWVYHSDHTGFISVQYSVGLNWPNNDQSAIRIVEDSTIVMEAFDMGPTPPMAGAAGSGGQLYQGPPPPPPPPPTRQYYVDLAPSGWTSWRGNNTARGDVSGPVQGWDPSGFNGDGKGHWWFSLPSISGRIDRMDFYAYSSHWYYNSGGTAILNVAIGGNGGPNYAKPRGDWHVGGWPKPGGVTATLPSDWYPLFQNGGAYGYGRADGITVGPSGGSNLSYYGRFDGGSARLRIWYTQ
ncbi:hypothetical protein JNUCC0626_18240 [Lentzea sp. JNUCC 0626]|uniref:hypothetical protein n=1 Tax=Lentzea sp. JNUCC 0626 TaxID=3367513 RepID=UPI003748EDF1